MVVNTNTTFTYDELNKEEKEMAEFSYMCLMQELAEYEDIEDVAIYNRLLKDKEFRLEMLKNRTYIKDKLGNVFVN